MTCELAKLNQRIMDYSTQDRSAHSTDVATDKRYSKDKLIAAEQVERDLIDRFHGQKS